MCGGAQSFGEVEALGEVVQQNSTEISRACGLCPLELLVWSHTDGSMCVVCFAFVCTAFNATVIADMISEVMFGRAAKFMGAAFAIETKLALAVQECEDAGKNLPKEEIDRFRAMYKDECKETKNDLHTCEDLEPTTFVKKVFAGATLPVENILTRGTKSKSSRMREMLRDDDDMSLEQFDDRLYGVLESRPIATSFVCVARNLSVCVELVHRAASLTISRRSGRK